MKLTETMFHLLSLELLYTEEIVHNGLIELNELIDRNYLSSINHLCNISSKNGEKKLHILMFQLLKCQDFLLLFVIYHCKLHI